MREALREANRAAGEDEVPIGAVIVCKGRIIGKGYNMTERLNDPTAHAEMIAITAATEAMGGKYLNECTLYVTVEPCPMCAGALAWSQIGRVVYGAADPKRGFSMFSPSLMPFAHSPSPPNSSTSLEIVVLLIYSKSHNSYLQRWNGGFQSSSHPSTGFEVRLRHPHAAYHLAHIFLGK